MARDIDLQQLHRSLTGTVQIPPYVPAMERSAYPTATDEIARLIDRCAELASEVVALQKLASDALKAWDADKDAHVGKLLRAMIDREFRSAYRHAHLLDLGEKSSHDLRAS